MRLVENGLEVLAQEEKTLSEDEARDFYKEHEEEVGESFHTVIYIKGNSIYNLLSDSTELHSL